MKSDGSRWVHGKVDHCENGSMLVVVDTEDNDLQLDGTTLVCTDVTTNVFVAVRGWIWENLKDWYTTYDKEISDSEDSEFASDSSTSEMNNDSSDGDYDDMRTKTSKKAKIAKKPKSHPR